MRYENERTGSGDRDESRIDKGITEETSPAARAEELTVLWAAREHRARRLMPLPGPDRWVRVALQNGSDPPDESNADKDIREGISRAAKLEESTIFGAAREHRARRLMPLPTCVPWVYAALQDRADTGDVSILHDGITEGIAAKLEELTILDAARVHRARRLMPLLSGPDPWAQAALQNSSDLGDESNVDRGMTEAILNAAEIESQSRKEKWLRMSDVIAEGRHRRDPRVGLTGEPDLLPQWEEVLRQSGDNLEANRTDPQKIDKTR